MLVFVEKVGTAGFVGRVVGGLPSLLPRSQARAASQSIGSVACVADSIGGSRSRVGSGAFEVLNAPNKTPEPTLGSVTPRATESVSEVKWKNVIRSVARGAPAPSVAHL